MSESRLNKKSSQKGSTVLSSETQQLKTSSKMSIANLNTNKHRTSDMEIYIFLFKTVAFSDF